MDIMRSEKNLKNNHKKSLKLSNESVMDNIRSDELQSFFDYEQFIFKHKARTAETYKTYMLQKFPLENIMGRDLRLFAHHLSEYSAMDGDFEEAKKRNKIAYDFNSPNKVTKGLYYYLNDMKNELEEFINEHTGDYQVNSLVIQIKAIEDNKKSRE